MAVPGACSSQHKGHNRDTALGASVRFLVQHPILPPVVVVVLNLKVCSQSNLGLHSALALTWGSMRRAHSTGRLCPWPRQGHCPSEQVPDSSGQFQSRLLSRKAQLCSSCPTLRSSQALP